MRASSKTTARKAARPARPRAAAAKKAAAKPATQRAKRPTRTTRTTPTKGEVKTAAAPARRCIAVSGSQSGLGLAIRRHLEAAGARVIGIDLPGKGAEVEADLSTPAGRQSAVQGVLEACGGTLQGLVANAGVDSKDADLTFAVNFHGAVDLLEGLRPALARAAKAEGAAAAVVTVSHAISVSPNVRTRAADALLAGHPGRAKLWLGGGMPYPVSKLALARWIRQHAPSADWAGAGIALNGVCPGAIETPLLERDLKDRIKGPIIRAMPKPLGHHAKPEDLVGIYDFLLRREARFIIGQLITADGGVEAVWRRDDWPQPWDISTPVFLFKLIRKQGR